MTSPGPIGLSSVTVSSSPAVVLKRFTLMRVFDARRVYPPAIAIA